ncbi:hypothetical protein D3C84_1274450 [compost metagenome]
MWVIRLTTGESQAKYQGISTSSWKSDDCLTKWMVLPSRTSFILSQPFHFMSIPA